MKVFYTLLALLMFIGGSSGLFAQQAKLKNATPVRFLIRGALEFGGDDVAEVYFTNGDQQSVKAGQGGTIAVGAELQIPGADKFLVHATGGIKYVTTKADNAHIRLTRIPLQLTANYMATRKLRLGAGVVTHQAIKFNSGGIGENMNFNSALGPTFEVAYSVIGITYTSMTYTDKANNKYSANALGISFTFALPARK